MQSKALSSVPSDRETSQDIIPRANEVQDKSTEATNALPEQIQSLGSIGLDVPNGGRIGPADLHQMSLWCRRVSLCHYETVYYTMSTIRSAISESPVD